MVNNVLLLLGVASGAGIAVQTIINARLRLAIGSPLWAAAAQFTVGLVMLVLLAVVSRQPFSPGAALRTPWWTWTGGLMGAFFIVMGIVLAPRVGVAVTLAVVLVGQLVAAMLIDHFGWLGADVYRVSAPRLAGALLLAAGVLLMRWR